MLPKPSELRADGAARSFMLMGTGSDVGKSVLVAGLCRYFSNRGLRVLPFKPQNMSNNAAVTPDGKEIGRAQALQARACRVPPHVDMNPVLLKPQSDVGAQVVVLGETIGHATAQEFQSMKARLPEIVVSSFERLRQRCDLVIVEGAGSPAEVNLRENDIANMGFATRASVPVVLVGDIDRGGVIASLVGTHALLPESERRLIRGFLINKFRGDVALFDGGRRIIQQRTGWADLGVVPWLPSLRRLPAEDSVDAAGVAERHLMNEPLGHEPVLQSRQVVIAVPLLSRIANFDDFDPLRADPGVKLVMVPPGQALPPSDLVILPGTKATCSDLRFLREQGWDIDLHAHVRRGGRVLGLCGGFQMLGATVSDPQGIEGPAGSARGLGYLDVQTELQGPKTLSQVEGVDVQTNQPITGYEMHMGRTSGTDCQRPLLFLDGRPEGAISPNGLVSGTYVHGLFASDGFRTSFLRALGARSEEWDYEGSVDQTLDEWAEWLERHLDMDGLVDGLLGAGLSK